LINRIVTAGLEVKAVSDFHRDIYRPNGGFGFGAKGLMFFAGLWLNDATMLSRPAVITGGSSGVSQPYFAEDAWWVQGNTRSLYGMDHSAGVAYTGNHEWRDPGGDYDPHNYPVHAGTAQSGTASSIRLAAGTNATVHTISAGYQIYLNAGTGSGQLREILSWSEATKDLGVTPDWTVTPNSTSQYRVSNGGTYQAIGTPSSMGLATAIVLAGKTTEWGSAIFFKGMAEWIAANGLMSAPNVYGDNANANYRKFYDANDVWIRRYYDVAAPSWPT
jgi:hypothetical protein